MILSENYKGNDVEYIDVAASEETKQKMRELSGNPKALPPQIFNGDTYCGVSLYLRLLLLNLCFPNSHICRDLKGIVGTCN